MKKSVRSSLLVKALGWLVLHLVVLALGFFVFVRWQLGMGLDSLLSGAAGERLRYFGESVRGDMLGSPPEEWNAAVLKRGEDLQVVAGIFDPDQVKRFPRTIPRNVLDRAVAALPHATDGAPGERRGAPPWSRRGGGMPGGGGGPPEGRGPWFGGPEPDDRPPPAQRPTSQTLRLPPANPVFLVRGDGGDGYWAGVTLPFAAEGQPLRPHLLLVRADRLDGSGMFFDLKPWLWGGMAVLCLSLVFWTPFMLGITRYLHRLTQATDGIAAGNFQVDLPRRGDDELGRLGQAIRSMAGRLDLLVTGQKRFLGDAAHELCAPLARIRTGLGILEMKLGDAAADNLASIEAETAELAALVEEILAFSRARTKAVRLTDLNLADLVNDICAREQPACSVRMEVAPEINVMADEALLGRAVANILRNAGIHAGENATVVVTATPAHDRVTLSLVDDGPGVDPEELPRLFEPFYRPDRSRTRETGGSGLGLAIVRTAVEACGGSASAFLPPSGGFGIRLELPVANA